MKPETAAACAAAISAVIRARDLLNAEGREAITKDDPATLVRTYGDLREQAEAIREEVTAFAKMEQALSYEVIPGSFDRAGIENIRVTGYGLVSLVHRTNCSIIKGKKEEGLAYLRQIGQSGMIIETVPAPTLGAWAKTTEAETGKEPPDDIFKVSRTRHCSLTPSR